MPLLFRIEQFIPQDVILVGKKACNCLQALGTVVSARACACEQVTNFLTEWRNYQAIFTDKIALFQTGISKNHGNTLLFTSLLPKGLTTRLPTLKILNYNITPIVTPPLLTCSSFFLSNPVNKGFIPTTCFNFMHSFISSTVSFLSTPSST